MISVRVHWLQSIQTFLKANYFGVFVITSVCELFHDSNLLTTSMKFEYPKFPQCSSVDDYHGYKVSDPYRWLEDPVSEETKAFIDAQNNLTFPYLKSCPDREKLNKRLTDLWNHTKYDCPFKAGKYYYFNMNSGLQNQSVLYKLKSLDGEPEVFIDPNMLSKEGLIAVNRYEISEDGEYMAFALSETGSDWNKIKIRSVATHEDLPDLIEDIKYSSIAWTHDNKGFFYSRSPNENKDDGTETTEHKNSKLYYHRIGTDQSDDILCVEFPDKPTWIPIAYVSCCGRYVFVSVQETCKNEVLYYCDMQFLPEGITGPLPLKCIVDKFEAEYNYVTNEGPVITFHTDKNAPLYRLININLEQPDEAHWVDVIPEDSKNVLDWAVCVNEDKLLTCYIEDVKSVLHLCDLKTGNRLHTFKLDVGHVRGVFGKKKESEIFFGFGSFLTPGVLYYCDLKENVETKIFREVTIPGFDVSKFETLQLFYPSKDGTQIPMFLVQPKGFVKDGLAPAFLYGYGGFNASLLPFFSIFRLIFVQHFRGVLAFPNLRGGGEYGEKWHAAGCKFNKQNVFDDFQAAAEFLVANKYTSPKKIIIHGASNGGLLVGACINQRPDLYGCAVAQVGVMDMLRYHKFTIGHAWQSDYCCSDNEEEFKYLLKISPLHNVKVPEDEHVQYPATLLVTADHDNRVVPLHSLKFIAELQHKLGNCPKQTNPLLIRVETKCGHGSGKPTAKVIEELTDIYCFICNTLGLEYKD